MRSAYHQRLKMLEQHGSMNIPKKASPSRAKRVQFIEMFVRQNGICIYCEERMVLQIGLNNSATIDHLTPKSRGGSNAQWNLALACYLCNQDKGDRTYDEYVKFIQERESGDPGTSPAV
jgi:5-methylcytosine-specific restriction endonuclease McrA